MKIRLYALRDDKMATFNCPVKIENDAVAVRQFGDLVTGDKEGLIGKHPNDFSLWFLGEFDIDTGRFFQSDDVGYVVARGSDFVKDDE